MLADLPVDDHCLVLLGKPHNVFDPGLNLHLAKKLRRLGWQVIPFDMLPTEEIRLPKKYDNVVWKNTRDLLKALLWIRKQKSFFPVLSTNFGCGPDSFLYKIYGDELTDTPHLVLEVDDHTGDAGMVTRIEAFLDTMHDSQKHRPPLPRPAICSSREEKGLSTPGPRPRIMKRLEEKTLYFPYVSQAFCHVVQGAFQAIDLQAEILPEPDHETEYLGRQVTSGRECHPFVVTCGEFVKLTRQPDLIPSEPLF